MISIDNRDPRPLYEQVVDDLLAGRIESPVFRHHIRIIDRGLGFFGHSNIIDPVGKAIESLDEPVEGVIHARIDLGLTEKRRKEYYTIFEDRRPDTYGEVVKL